MGRTAQNVPALATVPEAEVGSDATQDSRSLAVIRIAIGAMFVWVFFENYNKGAYTPAGYRGVIDAYLKSSHAPAAWKSVMAFVADHAGVAAPLQAISEFCFGTALVTGTASRLAAAAAAGFLFTLWLSELGTAWVWELLVPTLVAAALALTRPGRTWGVDALLSRRWPKLPIW
jgi:thiosulfate dehydrogenase [quinone] large subunit